MLRAAGFYNFITSGVSALVVGFVLITLGKISILLREIVLNLQKEKSKDSYDVIIKLAQTNTILGWIVIIGGWTFPLLGEKIYVMLEKIFPVLKSIF